MAKVCWYFDGLCNCCKCCDCSKVDALNKQLQTMGSADKKKLAFEITIRRFKNANDYPHKNPEIKVVDKEFGDSAHRIRCAGYLTSNREFNDWRVFFNELVLAGKINEDISVYSDTIFKEDANEYGYNGEFDRFLVYRSLWSLGAVEIAGKCP